MNRHFALVSHGVPHSSSSGGEMTCWAIVQTMLEAGHRVTVHCLLSDTDPFDTPDRTAALEELGARVSVVPISGYGAAGLVPAGSRRAFVRQLLWPRMESVFPSLSLAPRLRSLLLEEPPDAVFLYHWEAVAATYGVRVAPRLAAVDDPWHLPNLRRWQAARPALSRSYVAWSLGTLSALHHQPRFMATLLGDAESSGCFQAETARWLQQQGVPGCRYLASPIADACGPAWSARRAEAPRRARPSILLGPSDLNTSSTAAGIRLFAREILPRLERELGAEGFEVHVVGGGEPPTELARLLPRPSVRLRGRIEPPDLEFLSADVQLVPTPFVLGMRKRIATGFSFGACVVAHSCEAQNIPELEHEENALLADDGPGLADALVRALGDHALRERLGRGARQTYERCFHPSVAAAAIVSELLRLVADADARREADTPISRCS